MTQPPPSAAQTPIRRPRATPMGRMLSRIFPALPFDEPLESQFRHWYGEQVRARIRMAMWIPMSCLLAVMLAGGPFQAMRDAIFGSQHHSVVDVLRFGLVAPSCIALLIVTYTRAYTRWFALTAQIVAPLHAMSLVTMDILMQPQGYSLSSWIPL